MTSDHGGHHLSGLDFFDYTYDYADNILTESRGHKVNPLPFKNINTSTLTTTVVGLRMFITMLPGYHKSKFAIINMTTKTNWWLKV